MKSIKSSKNIDIAKMLWPELLRQLCNKIQNKKRLGDQRYGIRKGISDTDITDIFRQGNGTNEHKKFSKI